MPNVYIAADHAGFDLKEKLTPFLQELGYLVEDCGANELHTDDDYPDVVAPCAQKVAADSGSFGIVIGASGQGEAMVANRTQGIRAAVYYGAARLSQTDADGVERDMITSVRSHNDANILSLGARFISVEEAKEAVRMFLETAASTQDRHVRRVHKF